MAWFLQNIFVSYSLSYSSSIQKRFFKSKTCVNWKIVRLILLHLCMCRVISALSNILIIHQFHWLLIYSYIFYSLALIIKLLFWCLKHIIFNPFKSNSNVKNADRQTNKRKICIWSKCQIKMEKTEAKNWTWICGSMELDLEKWKFQCTCTCIGMISEL